MLLVAYAYRDLNRAVPDAGTSFTWTVKAFGPHVGWMCGWGLVIAIDHRALQPGRRGGHVPLPVPGRGAGRPRHRHLGRHARLVNVATCLAFVAGATYIAYRGMTTTKGVTYVLVAIQMVALALFVVFALVKAIDGDVPTAIGFEWSWLSPFIESFSACRRVRRSSCTGAGTPPVGQRGDSAAIVRRAGGIPRSSWSPTCWWRWRRRCSPASAPTGVGLGNPDTTDNVFAALADPVMGASLGLLLFLAVLASSASSLQTTFVPRRPYDARHECLQGAAGPPVADPPDQPDSQLRHAAGRRSEPRSSTR